MIFKGKIDKGILLINDMRRLEKYTEELGDIEVTVEIKKLKGLRTLQQNASLHLYYTKLSEALNDKGFTVHDIIKGEIEMFWTPGIIKELWKKLQKAMFGTGSTTKLKKSVEIDRVFDTMNKLISERTGGEVSVQFPCIEEMMAKEELLN